MLGITPTTYSLVETGKIDLTYYRICQLAQILDVETYEILGYDPNNICAVKTQQLRAEMKEYQDKVISLQDEVYTLHQKILYQQRKKKLK